MKNKLTKREYLYVSCMLFGMFFGAGNLIFPVHMGQMAGSNFYSSLLGFLLTGVGLPLLGVAALGISRSNGLYELASKVGRKYSLFFTCLLYLTIGPFFAIPRCATTSFTVGIQQILPQNEYSKYYLLLFSFIFFALALFFSLKPNKIILWVGKVLTPTFLLFLAILVTSALGNPSTSINMVTPEAEYLTQPFFQGFLEGYNTMDALASLAFGIVVVQVIQNLGVTEPKEVASSTIKAGIFSCLMMAVIYYAVALVGVESRGLFATSANGGIALAQIAQHYLGNSGLLILAGTVTFACLKTSVGLITSCSETFVSLFPKSFSYKAWVFIFSIVSFVIANFGLDAIISYSIPVLMLLYPLSITLITLSLCGGFFQYSRVVFVWTTTLTFIVALFYFFTALPESVLSLFGGKTIQIIDYVFKFLPFLSLGLGWLLPALIGFTIGLIIYFMNHKKKNIA